VLKIREEGRMKYLMFFIVVFMSSCKESESSKQRKIAQPVQLSNESRFSVARIGVVDDDLAYGGQRGVYLIKDSETGAEYFGVSGVGISETGSHTRMVGKTTVTDRDER
jgi:hypothetical protein